MLRAQIEKQQGELYRGKSIKVIGFDGQLGSGSDQTPVRTVDPIIEQAEEQRVAMVTENEPYKVTCRLETMTENEINDTYALQFMPADRTEKYDFELAEIKLNDSYEIAQE